MEVSLYNRLRGGRHPPQSDAEAYYHSATVVIVHTLRRLDHLDFLHIQHELYYSRLAQEENPVFPNVVKPGIRQGSIFLVCQREEFVAVFKRVVPHVKNLRPAAGGRGGGQLLALTLAEYNYLFRTNFRVAITPVKASGGRRYRNPK